MTKYKCRLLGAHASVLLLAAALPCGAQTPAEDGIPVTDDVVKAKCGTCHASDERRNLQMLSWTRTTPEGWQDALKRMILSENLMVTPVEEIGRAHV